MRARLSAPLRALSLGLDDKAHDAAVGGETVRKGEEARGVELHGVVDTVERGEIACDVVPVVEYPRNLLSPLD